MSLCAGVRVDVFEILFPFSGEASRCRLLNSVLYLLAIGIFGVALIEHMVDTVLINNVIVDAAVFCAEQHLRLTFKRSEVGIGVCVVCNEALAVIALQGEINHVLACFFIEDGLRRPYTFQFFLSFITFLHVDDGVRPVDKVGRFQHHQGAVRIPSVIRHHIGHDHVESLSVFAPQDMRVAYTSGRTDDFRVEHRLVAVQCIKRIPVHTDGKTYRFFTDVVSGEIREEIAYIVFFFCLGCLYCRHSSQNQCD